MCAHTETFSPNKLSTTAPVTIRRWQSEMARRCSYRFRNDDNFHWPFVLWCLLISWPCQRDDFKWDYQIMRTNKSSLFWLLFAAIDRDRIGHISMCGCRIDSFGFKFSDCSFDTFHVIHAADNTNQHSHRFWVVCFTFLLKLMRACVLASRTFAFTVKIK